MNPISNSSNNSIIRQINIINYLTPYFPNDISKLISYYECHLQGQPLIRSFRYGPSSFTNFLVIDDHPERIISRSFNDTLEIWDFKTGKRLDGERDGEILYRNVECFTTLPDDRIIYGTWSSLIKIVNTQSRSDEMISIQYKLEYTYYDHISCIAKLSDERIVCALYNGTITIINLKTRKCEAEFTNGSCVSCMIVLPGDIIVSGLDNGTLKIWNTSMGYYANNITLIKHHNFVTCVAILPDGRLISGSADKTLKIWNVQTGECELTLTGHTASVNCVAVMSSKQYPIYSDELIISGSNDCTLKIWNVRTGKCELTLKNSSPIMCIATLPDGQIISSCDTLKLWYSS
jgi:WD40 repeat protein